MITKKKNKKVLIIGLIAIVIVVAIVAVFIYVSGSKDRKLKETLHIAEQYLNELDYEKAVVAYEDAINIDPKCIDAYIGIADIYVAMSDEAECNSDYENAIKNCDSGLENLNRALNSELNDSETITAKIDEITTKKEKLQKKLDDQLAAEKKKLEEEQKAKEEEKAEEESEKNNEEYIVFGSYEQDGDTTNGPEPIEWEVLDRNENGTLLISRYVLDCVPYNKTEQKVAKWESSYLREWMNNDFYNAAFTEEEKSKINTVELDNGYYDYFYRDDSYSGNKTSDKVFCLNYGELEKYYDIDLEEYYGGNGKLIITATQYAIDKGCFCHEIGKNESSWYDGSLDKDIGHTGTCWWVREESSHDYQEGAVIFQFIVNYDSSLLGTDQDNDVIGVRPAIYLFE